MKCHNPCYNFMKSSFISQNITRICYVITLTFKLVGDLNSGKLRLGEENPVYFGRVMHREASLVL